jgi:hypothetical protein
MRKRIGFIGLALAGLAVSLPLAAQEADDP